MDCPNCKLANPPTATRCDCGYDFQTDLIRDSYLTERDKNLKLSPRDFQIGWFCLFALLVLCLLPWFRLFGLSGMVAGSGNPLTIRDYLFIVWIWTFPFTLAVALIFRRRIPALIVLPLLYALSFIIAGLIP